MAIWTEEVSNEGHVYAALDDDLASFTFWLAFEDGFREMFSDAAEELAMEEGQRTKSKVMPRPKQGRSLDNGWGSVGEGPSWFDTIWP